MTDNPFRMSPGAYRRALGRRAAASATTSNDKRLIPTVGLLACTGRVSIRRFMDDFEQVALVGLGLPALAGAQAQATVLAPAAAIADSSQARLLHQWRHWAASFSPRASPVTDTCGAYASLRHKGSVTFLAGSGTSNPIVRKVAVRNDQTLFFTLTTAVSGYTDQRMPTLV